ncbi:hypothetical protein FKW77_004537 [Venturia effusa]|uniref:tRNA-dihydrouridine(47) synthase [NAD(P)(+)] n=1 Tax=Venturia effusa TaxID=50376 RepID=A0A517L5A7_9PEZI|nr:hypothetical protein FKW77_004537 [Venturia effusa]
MDASSTPPVNASSNTNPGSEDINDRPAKRVKMEETSETNGNREVAPTEKPKHVDGRDTKKGTAPIKAEYIIERSTAPSAVRDDDAAEEGTFLNSGSKPQDDRDRGKEEGGKKWKNQKGGKKEGGQNKNREYGSWSDALKLCNTRALSSEFSPNECKFGAKCKMEHDLRKYMMDGRREDLDSFGGVCPNFGDQGYCPLGWKCRFVKSHSTEQDTEDGRKELVLSEDAEKMKKAGLTQENKKDETGIYNVITTGDRIDLERRRVKTPSADRYTEWLSETWSAQAAEKNNRRQGGGKDEDEDMDEREDSRATFTEPPFRPSEKRRLYYGPDTPILAPLTTQGNLPFRRLCVELGAQITWSEMAMAMPLIQGARGEWSLMKAHESEISPPTIQGTPIIQGYDHAKDLKFGAQISANKPWLAFKATEILEKFCPRLRAIDLNCGCPIDMVYKSGAGSALLDSPSKLEKILRGMNALSGEIPITAKIRMGVKDNSPNADSIAKRLVLGGRDAVDAGLGPCGIAALTLHGRSRQQRYTREADWKYIAEISTLIKELKNRQSESEDTIRAADPRDLPNGGKVYFIGNGDCYSHVDYNTHIEQAGVDGIMIGRGALIKPWLFEEIASNQYLDKSATERLAYVEKFCKFGMQTWGSDEMGIGTTRRFLLEWLSFTCRYVPIGILERLPPKLNERPPPYKGRNELETLLASSDFRDWIKISEMFLGPAHKDFKFVPKHKSNAHEMEAEG